MKLKAKNIYRLALGIYTAEVLAFTWSTYLLWNVNVILGIGAGVLFTGALLWEFKILQKLRTMCKLMST